MKQPKTIIFVITAGVVIILIVWFTYQPSDTSQVTSVKSNSEVNYVCPSGSDIKAVFRSDSSVIIMTVADTSLKLNRTQSADGQRYANSQESFILWNKGTYAMITRNGIIETCINQDNLAQVDADKRAVKEVVTEFGLHLQRVSLLAPKASETLAQVYAPYVTSQLLSKWKHDLSSAPGRIVSSPWPDHFIINRIQPSGVGYSVNATLVLMTSNEVEHGGNFGTKDVEMTLAKKHGGWKINSYRVVHSSRKE